MEPARGDQDDPAWQPRAPLASAGLLELCRLTDTDVADVDSKERDAPSWASPNPADARLCGAARHRRRSRRPRWTRCARTHRVSIPRSRAPFSGPRPRDPSAGRGFTLIEVADRRRDHQIITAHRQRGTDAQPRGGQRVERHRVRPRDVEFAKGATPSRAAAAPTRRRTGAGRRRPASAMRDSFRPIWARP